jgi:dUTPase
LEKYSWEGIAKTVVGEKYAQIAVIEKPDYEIIELNDEQFEILKSNQSRGDKGFGSSGN